MARRSTRQQDDRSVGRPRFRVAPVTRRRILVDEGVDIGSELLVVDARAVREELRRAPSGRYELARFPGATQRPAPVASDGEVLIAMQFLHDLPLWFAARAGSASASSVTEHRCDVLGAPSAAARRLSGGARRAGRRRAATRPSGRLRTATRRPAGHQVADGERSQRAVLGEVGAEQGAGRQDAGSASSGCSSEGGRWTTAADSRASGSAAGDGARSPRVRPSVSWQTAARGDAASGRCATSRSSTLARPAVATGSSAARGPPPVRSASGPVGLRGRAGERRGRGPRSLAAPTAATRTTAPPPASARRSSARGLAEARGGDREAVGDAGIGDGGRRRTVTRPPSTETSTSSSAQPGSASRAASTAGPPEASASAPASAAPSASVSA